MNDLIAKVLEQDTRSAARLIRAIDDRHPQTQDLLKELFPHTGKAYVVGITGSPGVGKSTLTDALIAHLRQLGKTVGVLAIDPSSPFSGGALLGDRIRMQRHSTDPGVFMRSLATRGQVGGVSRSTHGAVMVMDAMGKDCIIVETVGVGQDEIDIVRMAKTTVVVLAPGLGDGIQAIKSGILEAGDIFVVNKADSPMADQTVMDLKTAVSMAERNPLGDRGWSPPIVKTVAVNQEGIESLWEAIQEHAHLLSEAQGEYYRRLNRIKAQIELHEIIKDIIIERVMQKLEQSGDMERYIDALIGREQDPYTLSEEILVRTLAELTMPD